jgi:hypothetical protein
MSGKKRIVIYSRDIGGTNQLVEVRRLLLARRKPIRDFAAGLEILEAFAARIDPDTDAEVVVVAKDHAVGHWQALDIIAVPWDAIAPAKGTPEARAQAAISALSPTSIITATTDVDDRTDVHLWQVARENGLRSAAFVDHRINLEARFFGSDGRMLYPDEVFVIDEDVRREIVAAGVPANRVRVAGDLHLARLAEEARLGRGSAAAALRADWGVGDADPVVLFVSECLREMRACGSPGAPYDEIHTLEGLIARVVKGEDPGGLGVDWDRATIVVRPHPKDTPGKFAAVSRGARPRVIVSNAGLATDAIFAADGVLGMDSTMLYEAQALGRPVASLVPHSNFARQYQPKTRIA